MHVSGEKRLVYHRVHTYPFIQGIFGVLVSEISDVLLDAISKDRIF